MLYLCRVKPLRHYLRGFLIAAWAGDKIAEFSFPEISFHFPLCPWFFFVSPAYAGKSHSYLNSTFLNLGSPPRMRGKVIHSLCDRPQRGITPAYAGKRARPKTPPLTPRDHPRMCGEKVSPQVLQGHIQGSPPRMWGKEQMLAGSGAAHRITPAYAGKSTSALLFLSCSWDHPRVCGEKSVVILLCVATFGSPPRMRGKAGPNSAYNMASGITPACAGKRLRMLPQ